MGINLTRHFQDLHKKYKKLGKEIKNDLSKQTGILGSWIGRQWSQHANSLKRICGFSTAVTKMSATCVNRQAASQTHLKEKGPRTATTVPKQENKAQ